MSQFLQRASVAVLFVLHAFITSAQMAASPDGIDPWCNAPSRTTVVWMERAKAARATRLKKVDGNKAADYSDTAVGLSWNAVANLPNVLMHGPNGTAARIDTTPGLGSTDWQSFLTVRFGASELNWPESSSTVSSSRFYRILTLPDDPMQEEVDDFLLLDHLGKARELFYPNNLKALVVATAGESMAQLDAVVAALKPISTLYSSTAVQFWILLHDGTVQRADVAAKVASLGVTFPVLMDTERWGAMALRLTRAGEVAVIQPPTFTLAYRGQLDLVTSPAPSHPLLTTALDGVVHATPYTMLRTPLNGAPLSLATDAPVYSRDVAPVFYNHCAICHRTNDVAPFAMTNYDVVASWAPLIKQKLLSGEMPPWHADPIYGHWSNSLALPPSAKTTLIRWVDAGMPRGDGPDPLAESAPSSVIRAWPAELGPPDAIVTPGVQSIKLLGVEAYRYLFVQAPNETDVWLRAAIILPTSPAITHHYLVWPDKIGNQGLPGLTPSTYQSALAEYVPGVVPYIYPSDSGFFLAKSNWLTFNLHYTPNNKDTTDLPQLALWYHKTPPPKRFHLEGFPNTMFNIPPGNPEYAVQVTQVFDHEVRVHRLNPHMHLRGKRMSFEAFYPDGTHEMLLSVPDYAFKWQSGYELAEPKTLPAGSKIVFKGAFDNSAQNPANPNPAVSVTWGDQSSSEMFVGFVDYVD